MITLTEVIEVERSVEACFRYVSDFRTTVEWDATAVAARKLSPGPVGKGSHFSVLCKAGPTKLTLDYCITEFTPWQSVVLEGTSRFFHVKDVITFDPLSQGRTRITYVAEFRFRCGLDLLARNSEAGMQKMGRASLRGLARALADGNPAPSASAETERKDRKLATALACFTRYGHRRGRRKWLPMSSDMAGKHVLLTGANAGLGFATAVSLLEAGATLTVVIRDPAKLDLMQQAFEAETGRRADRVELADLSLLGDVNRLCQKLLHQGEPIDVLINNAGALFNDYAVTREGLERSVSLLLLSPWRLTEQLLPLLRRADTGGRVTNDVPGHTYTPKLPCPQLPLPEHNYDGTAAYARAKRALTVLTELWADQWAADNIVVNSMHPGWADTPGVQNALPGFRRVTKKVLRTPDQGADTVIWLARATEADKLTGKLFLDREPRTTHLRARTIEDEGERARLPEWLGETYDALSPAFDTEA